MKKAQSISINTIIVAAIALIVMVVLIFIFTQKSGDFVRTGEQCTSVGGSCDVADINGKCPAGWLEAPQKCDETGTLKCCLKVLERPEGV